MKLLSIKHEELTDIAMKTRPECAMILERIQSIENDKYAYDPSRGDSSCYVAQSNEYPPNKGEQHYASYDGLKKGTHGISFIGLLNAIKRTITHYYILTLSATGRGENLKIAI